MAYIYAGLIRKETINPKTGKPYVIDDVPLVIRADVEKILDQEGKIDPDKLAPILFDPVHNTYRKVGEKVGNAFRDGLQLK